MAKIIDFTTCRSSAPESTPAKVRDTPHPLPDTIKDMFLQTIDEIVIFCLETGSDPTKVLRYCFSLIDVGRVSAGGAR